MASFPTLESRRDLLLLLLCCFLRRQDSHLPSYIESKLDGTYSTCSLQVMGSHQTAFSSGRCRPEKIFLRGGNFVVQGATISSSSRRRFLEAVIRCSRPIRTSIRSFKRRLLGTRTCFIVLLAKQVNKMYASNGLGAKREIDLREPTSHDSDDARESGHFWNRRAIMSR